MVRLAKRRWRAVAVSASAIVVSHPGRGAHRDSRIPSRKPACRSPGPTANNTARSAGQAAARRSGIRSHHRQVRRLTASSASGQRSGLLRVLRTSLTSTSAYRGGPVSVGKRPLKCGRLPSRSRRCRVRSSCLAAPPTQPASGRCHQRGYCPFARSWVKTRHRWTPVQAMPSDRLGI
jgi:hypothetical protein